MHHERIAEVPNIGYEMTVWKASRYYHYINLHIDILKSDGILPYI